MSADEESTGVKLNTLTDSTSRVKTPSPQETNLETQNVSSISPLAPSVEKKVEEHDDKKELTPKPEPASESSGSVDCKKEGEQSNEDATVEEGSSSTSARDYYRRLNFTVPKINYTEKIIFCLDMSSDMEQTPFKLGDGSQHTPLSMVKRTIELFVENKHFINRKHEFSLMVLYENATWVRDFTNDPKELIDSLQDLTETQDCTSCDLASLVTLITNKYEMKIPRRISLLPFVFRVILIYGRSSCMIHFSNDEAREFLINYPFLILDIVYIHEPPSNDNKCQEIFEAFCDLDEHNKSYIFEVTRNTTKLHNCMAKLLTHPIQRTAQKDTSYSIRLPQDLE